MKARRYEGTTRARRHEDTLVGEPRAIGGRQRRPRVIVTKSTETQTLKRHLVCASVDLVTIAARTRAGRTLFLVTSYLVGDSRRAAKRFCTRCAARRVYRLLDGERR